MHVYDPDDSIDPPPLDWSILRLWGSVAKLAKGRGVVSPGVVSLMILR